MNPLLNPWFWVAVGIMAISLAVFAIAIHNAETHPDEWPALQAAEQEQPTVEFFRSLREHPSNLQQPQSVVPFRTTTKDRIAGQIAANEARRAFDRPDGAA